VEVVIRASTAHDVRRDQDIVTTQLELNILGNSSLLLIVVVLYGCVYVRCVTMHHAICYYVLALHCIILFLCRHKLTKE